MEQNIRKTVIITGATKGIGKGIALKLAGQKYNIVLNYVSDDQSAKATLAICQQMNANVLLFKADVSKKSDVEALMWESVKTFHSIDVLINNAGINIDKPLHEVTEEDWDQVVDTNMKGVFLCSQIVSTFMLQQDSGGIILNVAAATGIRGRTNGIQYCAAKAGVFVMTKCLALELAPRIRVNCLVPGLVRTGETEERFQLHDPERLRAQEETIPLGRIGTPDDIANVVTFLLSPEAAFINGQKIIVDGGRFMW